MTKQTDRVGLASAEPVSIMITDDHPVVRCGLVHLFVDEPGIDVVGEAASCRELCAKVVDLRPDVVVLDLELGDATGVEGVVRLREHSDDCCILVFTARKPEYLALELLRHDLQGIVVKGTPYATLCRAVRAMTRGSLYLDPAVASAVRRQFATPSSFRCGTAEIQLTGREYAVLRCIADGRRNREIAEQFGVSERAVKYHVTSLLAKLGARSRAEVVEKAAGLKLIAQRHG